MSAYAAVRLTKGRRKKQLLETAFAMVSEHGTEGLTLCALAHKAGVTHALAYRHFKTRTGLITALFQQLEPLQVERLLTKLSHAAPSLEGIARAISEAYMSSIDDGGREWHALSAALLGSEELDVIRQQLTYHYSEICVNALAPYSGLTREELHLRCMSIRGAAEAIFHEMVRGHIHQDHAVNSLTSIIASCAPPRRTVSKITSVSISGGGLLVAAMLNGLVEEVMSGLTLFGVYG